jgi:hypothetical protein
MKAMAYMPRITEAAVVRMQSGLTSVMSRLPLLLVMGAITLTLGELDEGMGGGLAV